MQVRWAVGLDVHPSGCGCMGGRWRLARLRFQDYERLAKHGTFTRDHFPARQADVMSPSDGPHRSVRGDDVAEGAIERCGGTTVQLGFQTVLERH